MNAALVRLAIFTRDLLQQPEYTVVQIGRENFRRDDFNGLQIVIDSLGVVERISTSYTYDAESESMAYNQRQRFPCTIDFYGDAAYTEADKFMLLLQSQKSYELQRDNNVTVFKQGGLTDLKLLAGDDYSNRLQITLNVQLTSTYIEEVWRVETPQFTVIVDE